MKKKIALILALAIAMVTLVGCSSNETESTATEETGDGIVRENMALSVGTGPSGSTNYGIVSGMANLISQKYSNYTFTPEISTGSAQNVRLIEQGTSQLGVCMADAAYAAYNGEREFDETTVGTINFVMGGYETVFNQIAPEDTDIETFTDLKGKKVGVSSGTMAQSYWPMLLEAHGMTEADLETVALSFNDIINGIADGTIDYGVFVTSVPNSSVSDLALTSGIKVFGFDEETRKNISEEYPYFQDFVVNKDVYGQEEDVVTLGTRNTIIASPDLDAQVVYDFLDVVLSSQEDLELISPAAGAFNKENALIYSDLIPMHPGAEQYYKDNGMLD